MVGIGHRVHLIIIEMLKNLALNYLKYKGLRLIINFRSIKAFFI